MKVLTVAGTRPEAIKLAPVLQELRRKESSGVSPVLCVTGQHRQMLDQVMRLFQLVPDHDLNVMTVDQSPAQVAAAVLERFEPILKSERPDWVLVQGDTTTAMAAALTAFYGGVKVGHVEAGLRTHDRHHPFPEEINRKVIGAVADMHFAPTERARANLLREDIPEATILVTGNTVIDALHWAAALPEPPEVSRLLAQLGIPATEGARSGSSRVGDSWPAERPDHPLLILVTAHRRENLGGPLEQVCLALRDIAVRYKGRVQLVYPVHLNPNVREPVQRILGGVPGIALIPPLDYLPLVHLMKRSYLVLTDSGGIQEEAPSLGKPVLVLRDATERPEAVEAGTVNVIGADRGRLVEETARLIEDPKSYAAMARAVNPYGDGHASERIVNWLLQTQV